MGEIAIRVEKLSKRYRIGLHEETNDTFVGMIAATLRSPLRNLKRLQRLSKFDDTEAADVLWALRDINFEVEAGAVIGVIGRNGAGKSTLLKVLSRITHPTTGRIELIGRVASLLEVGTGFHPELTGRENVYLNGTILGMTKVEVDQKFDEIVEFSGIAKFIDTPVKRYSSGMRVRLAFSVAAYLEPEILLIDEVLAVGDIAFQNKCIGKMNALSQGGRTVLFVSHNMVAVQSLCERVIWIDEGEIKREGPTTEVINAYLNELQPQSEAGDFSESIVSGDGGVVLLDYEIWNASDPQATVPLTNQDMGLRVRVRVEEEISVPACGIAIYNHQGVLMTSINTVEHGTELPAILEGEATIKITLKDIAYLPGKYTMSFWMMNPQGHVYVMAEHALRFEVGQSNLYGVREIDNRWGVVFTEVEFAVGERDV